MTPSSKSKFLSGGVVRSASSLALLACLAASALADIPPPPPASGFKRVPYEIVMKLEKEIPGYKFYTFRRIGLGGQEEIGEELKLGTENGVAVASSSSPSVRTGVVAVPEEVMADLKTEENLAKMLSREEKGNLPVNVVIFETSGTSMDLEKSDPRSKVQDVVTISPDEETGVVFTARQTPAPLGQDSEGTGTGPSTQSSKSLRIAGIAGTLAIITLGIWLFRRNGVGNLPRERLRE